VQNSGINIPDPQPEPRFRVSLPCKMDIINRDTDCEPESIEIPDGRPIYALLVSGFHQNRDLDMFHYYNFARCLIEKGAYVHFAWWNNLLAPYMERPLHNAASVPSYQGSPIHDIIGFTLGVQPTGSGYPFPNKALPAEDYQFQADAKALLEAIHQHNPDATVVLVGHSMGGNAIVRLAQEGNIDNIDIALLAPIDPVGNRSCVENYPGAGMNALTSTCNGAFNFTRWRAIRSDVMGNSVLDWALYYPPKRPLGTNVKYLYHRWQQEFMPPFDYSCPEGGNAYWPCGSWYPEENEYLFDHSETSVAEANNFPESNNGLDNVQLQSRIVTDLFSGQDVPVIFGNFAGGLDGHGEIVGFRGTLFGGLFNNFNEWFEYIIADLTRLGEFESYPLALKAEGNWPSYQNEKCTRYDPDLLCRRVELMKAWEKQKNYLDDLDHAPLKPTNVTKYEECVDSMSDGCTFCMVSEDLCTILDKIVVTP